MCWMCAEEGLWTCWTKDVTVKHTELKGGGREEHREDSKIGGGLMTWMQK